MHLSPTSKLGYLSFKQHVVTVYLESRVESLAVCMPHMEKLLANFYAKDLTLNAGRRRLRCAWALMLDCLKLRPHSYIRMCSVWNCLWGHTL